MATIIKRCRHPRSEWETCGCAWLLRRKVAGRDTYVNLGHDLRSATRQARRLCGPFAAGGLTDAEIAAWDGQEVVYFVRGGAHTKVGMTTSLPTRVDQLRRSSPLPLDVEHVISGGRQLEAAMHEEFAVHRTHGEWFRLPPRWRAIATTVQARFSTGAALVRPKHPVTDPTTPVSPAKQEVGE